MINKTLVIGHKNPDTDSVCAAYCYSELKNKIHGQGFQAVRCGHLPQQTQFVFQYAGVKPPLFIKNVFPSVADAMSTEITKVDINDPLIRIVKNFDPESIHTTPVISKNNHYEGVISLLEVTRLFLFTGRTRLFFRSSNCLQVMNGQLVHRGIMDNFEAAIIIGAMEENAFFNRISELKNEKAILIVGNRSPLLQHAIQSKTSVIFITGISNAEEISVDYSDYEGWIFISKHDTIETSRRLQLSIPMHHIMKTDANILSLNDSLDKAKQLFRESMRRGIPIIENGIYKGMLTRTDILKNCQKKLILVDHNELTQAVEGAEQSEIVEILDHHRLGTIKTRYPISVYAKPVGSSCTLVYQQFQHYQIQPEYATAILIIAGILCDTLGLKSPTCTQDDRDAVESLATQMNIDWHALSQEIIANTAKLKSREPIESILSDFKIYNESDIKLGIGQIEVVDLDEVPSMLDALLTALKEVKLQKSLDGAMLLITDIVHAHSILLTSGWKEVEQELKYKESAFCVFDLPGVLSRKKQLLPEILRAVEECKAKKS